MASIQPRSGRWQIRVTNRLLHKPYFATFDTEVEARTYAAQLERLLASGIVPAELMAPEERTAGADPTLAAVIGDYQRLAPVTASDDELLAAVRPEVAGVRVSGVTMRWAEGYVAGLKLAGRERGPLTPGSIRKRVGALARVLDWHFHRSTPDGGTAPVNVLRLMPRGYSLYTKQEAEALPDDMDTPEDETRDFRLPPDDEAKLWAVLAGEKRPGRERALKVDVEFQTLTALILDTGVRLSEAMTLDIGRQIDLQRRLIHVDGSKGHRGKIKPRTVPMKRRLADRLASYCEGRTGLLFPSMWDGDPTTKRKAAHRLSVRFSAALAYAGLDHMTEHDLRHEATCRWFELRAPGGGWVFSDIEICRIMGWTDTRMALRYASLRGEDLSARLLD